MVRAVVAASPHAADVVPFDASLFEEAHYDDSVHPSDAGYDRMAATAYDALVK